MSKNKNRRAAKSQPADQNAKAPSAPNIFGDIPENLTFLEMYGFRPRRMIKLGKNRYAYPSDCSDVKDDVSDASVTDGASGGGKKR